MQFGLRIQDIIGLVLAVLIVAILISIILIIRENARERRMWREEEYEEEEPTERPVRRAVFSRVEKSQGATPVVEKKRFFVRREKGEEEEEAVKPATKETHGEVETVPIAEVVREEPREEPKQVVLERALRKLEDLGIDFGAMKPLVGEDSIHFSPLLFEIRDEVKAGKELGDVVIHTVFKSVPGYSPDEIIDRYRSGDVSVVEKLEARVKTREGRDFLIATMNLSHFEVPELDRQFRLGNLENEEYELLRALKFVDRTTKRDFARIVYARIVGED